MRCWRAARRLARSFWSPPTDRLVRDGGVWALRKVGFFGTRPPGRLHDLVPGPGLLRRTDDDPSCSRSRCRRRCHRRCRSASGLLPPSASPAWACASVSPTSASDRLSRAAAEIAAFAPAGSADVMAAAADVARVDDVVATGSGGRERFGGTDVLMNNAGVGPGSARSDRRKAGAASSASTYGASSTACRSSCRHDRRGAARPDHQHRLEAGHHHAAGQPRLQCLEGGGEGLHRGAAA